MAPGQTLADGRVISGDLRAHHRARGERTGANGDWRGGLRPYALRDAAQLMLDLVENETFEESS